MKYVFERKKGEETKEIKAAVALMVIALMGVIIGHQ